MDLFMTHLDIEIVLTGTGKLLTLSSRVNSTDITTCYCCAFIRQLSDAESMDDLVNVQHVTPDPQRNIYSDQRTS